MEMLTLELVGTLRSQVAEALVSAAVLPSTTAVLPTKPSACVDCAVCCSDTSVVSWELVLSCCSTEANCTSCWVNWFVSRGESGSWFCNCVVSSVRKVWKFPASVLPVVELTEEELDEDEAGRGVVPETTGAATPVAAAVVMFVSSDADVDAAARSEHAAIGSPRDRRGDRVFFTDDQTLRIAAGLVAAVLARRGLIAQAELQPAIAGLETGVIQRALQLGGVLAQHRQRFGLFDSQMRGDLAIAIDVDANIDAAEVSGIKPDFEAALAASCRGGDLEREPVQRYRRVDRGGDGERQHRRRRSRCGG